METQNPYSKTYTKKGPGRRHRGYGLRRSWMPDWWADVDNSGAKLAKKAALKKLGLRR